MESTKCTSNMIVPEVLTEKNYEEWTILMKRYLLGEGLWNIVDGSEGKPERIHDSKFKTWNMRNGKALHAITISCGEEAFFLIKERETAKDAWDHLASNYMFQRNTTNEGGKKLLSKAETTVPEEKKPLPIGQGEMAAADKLALCRAVYFSDWETTKSLWKKLVEPDITTTLSERWGTVLHVAVGTGNLHFVNQLLKFMNPNDINIATKNCNKYNSFTPLHVAAACGFTKIAQLLVGKNKDPLQMRSSKGYIPVVLACANSHKDTTRYLYKLTTKDTLIGEDGTTGATLVNLAIVSEMYDIAFNLLRDYPWLSITKDLIGWTTIKRLVMRPNAFASGGHCNTWQQWVYSIPGIKSIYNKKKTRVGALEVLKIVCSKLSSLDKPKLRELEVHDSLLSAAEFGIVEIVSELAKIDPEFLLPRRGKANMFSTAILNRQEKIFNFFCGQRGQIFTYTYVVDDKGNTVLHYAARLSPLSQQRKTAGAALQMQRELQWFQEVEKIMPSLLKDKANNEGLTPHDLFTKEHAELLKNGEKWMKDTASSCMIVGTLIATVTFAAAFTIPGGNDQTWDFPFFLRRNLILLFIISDALSLSSSSTSVMMFVSIYTSRYAEVDFLESLPKRLLIGLSTLLFSMATMMVAFCATLFLLLDKHYRWAAILITFLASIPVTCYIWLQFPLFRDMIHSTYGQGVFNTGKKTSNNHNKICTI